MDWLGKHFDQIWPVAAVLLGVVTTSWLDRSRVDREWDYKETTRREQYQREQLHELQEVADRYQQSIFVGWAEVDKGVVATMNEAGGKMDSHLPIFASILFSQYRDEGARNSLHKLLPRITDDEVVTLARRLVNFDTSWEIQEPKFVDSKPVFLFTKKDMDGLSTLVQSLNDRVGVILAS
jgi:hypothetical protein